MSWKTRKANRQDDRSLSYNIEAVSLDMNFSSCKSKENFSFRCKLHSLFVSILNAKFDIKITKFVNYE